MTGRVRVDVGFGTAVGLLLGLWLVGWTWGYQPPPAWVYFGLWAVAPVVRAAVVFNDARRPGAGFLRATAHGALVALVELAAWLLPVGGWIVWSLSSFGP